VTNVSLDTEIQEAHERVAAAAQFVDEAKAALDRFESRSFTPQSVVTRAKEALEDALVHHSDALAMLQAATKARDEEVTVARRAADAKKTASQVVAFNVRLAEVLGQLAELSAEAAEVAAEIDAFRVPSHLGVANFADEWTRQNVDASRVYWLAGEGRILVENLRAGRPFARRRR
jgi:hypothetical protein